MLFSRHLKFVFGNGIFARWRPYEFAYEKRHIYSLISTVLYSLDAISFRYRSQNEIYPQGLEA
jgi:hypothetical protein